MVGAPTASTRIIQFLFLIMELISMHNCYSDESVKKYRTVTLKPLFILFLVPNQPHQVQTFQQGQWLESEINNF